MTNAVLNFVNAIRQTHGLAPVTRIEPGMRLRQRDCALARTIGGGAAVGRRHTHAFGRHYRNPLPVRRWLRQFDRGKYPELTTLRPTRTTIAHLDFQPHANPTAPALAAAGATT